VNDRGCEVYHIRVGEFPFAGLVVVVSEFGGVIGHLVDEWEALDVPVVPGQPDGERLPRPATVRFPPGETRV